MSGDESKDNLGEAVVSLARLIPKDVARGIVHGEKLITTKDGLERVRINGHRGKYYFKPSLEEYEKTYFSSYRNRFREGITFHVTIPQGVQQVKDFEFLRC